MGEAAEGIDKEIRTRYNKHSSYHICQGVPVVIQGKRELGESPKRSRRCKREAICRSGHWFLDTGKTAFGADPQVRKPARVVTIHALCYAELAGEIMYNV